MSSNLVCVGKVTSPHGIKGAVKIKSFTQEPYSLEEYSPLYSKDGSESFDIKILSAKEDMLVVLINNVASRNEAEALRGRDLYASKDLFPATEDDEFFYEDLVGMRVDLENGEKFGQIIALHDHGGGDIVEVKLQNSAQTELFAFTRMIFPIVNVADGFVIIKPLDVEFVEEG